MDIIDRIEDKGLAKRNKIKEAILSGDSQVQKFYDDAVVFITGGSGFIGKQLIEKLMRSSNIRKIYILLRPKKGKTIGQRLNTILKDPVYGILRKEKPNFEEKIVAIEGDVSDLNLGIDDKNWTTLVDELNIIIHAAATINFEETVKVATLTNIRGTRETLKLAKECKNLKSIVHVSTAYAYATKSRIKKVVKEDFYKSPIPPDTLIELAEKIDEDKLNVMMKPLMADWPNSYTFTKAVTEDLVRRQAGDLPLCIVRPAIVISAYGEPVPGWVDTKNAFGPSGMVLGIGLGVTHTVMSTKDIVVDLVPVDIVNNAIIVAAWETFMRYNRGDKKTIIYTVAGARNPMLFRDLSRILNNESRMILPAKALWYCFAIETPYKYIYLMLTWLLHYIPGLVVDGCCLLTGKKARFFKTYKMVYHVSFVFIYFTNNDWKFKDTNTLDMYNKLTETDKILYNFDMSNIDITEMVVLWCYGVRKYIVKDDMDNDYSRKKQFWLTVIHYILFPIYIFLLCTIAFIIIRAMYGCLPLLWRSIFYYITN